MIKRRIMAWCLAIAMTVSSLPMGLGMETKSVKAAESTTDTSSNKLFQWEGESGYEYSDDGYYASNERSFQSPTYKNFTLWRPDILVNEEKAIKLLKSLYTLPEDVEVTTYSSSNVWTEVDENGEVIETLSSTSSWPTIYSELTNEDPDKKWYYRCVSTLNYIRLSDGEAYYIDDMGDYVTESDYTLQYDVTIQYTGPTVERLENGEVEMSQYVSGLDSLQDQMYVYTDEAQNVAESSVFDGASFLTGTSMNLNDVKVDSDYDDYMKIVSKWYAYSVDGDELELTDKAAEGSSITATQAKVSQEFIIYDEAGNVSGPAVTKTVDYYECKFSVYHGDTELADYSVKFDLTQAPFKYDPSEIAREVEVKQGATATLTMNTQILDGDCTGIMYQWYKVAKDGEETKLTGQNAKSLKARVKDYDTMYKCVLQAKFAEGYEGEAYITSGLFKMIPSADYKVKEISDEYVYLAPGESQTLSIKAVVNDGYSLSYRWLEGYWYDDYDEFIECGTGKSITVTAMTEDDYDKRYYLEVSVKKDDKIVEEYTYYYYLNEDYYVERTDNSGTIYALRGEDTELYADYKEYDTVKVSKEWFVCFEESTYYTSNWDSSLGEYVYTYADGYVPPAEDEYDLRYSYSSYIDGSWRYMHRFYKSINPEETEEDSEDTDTEDTNVEDTDSEETEKIDPSQDPRYMIDKDGNLILKGKDEAGEAYDHTGAYICVPTYLIEEEGEEEPREITASYIHYTVKYQSNLEVRVKSTNVQAPIGTSATLQVMANNDNQEAYPITYTWERFDAATGKYITIQDEEGEPINTDTYKIKSVENTDYGTYRVTIDDTLESEVVTIVLTEKALKYRIYTPEESYYYKNIGDEVTFKVETDIENDMEIYYEWYQRELVYEGNDTDWDDVYVYTELAGKEGNTCTVKINSAEDLCNYKCVLTFKTADSNGNPILLSEEVYFYVRPAGEFTLLPVTKTDEYKKLGSSRTYTVKPVTNIAGIDNSKIEYSWYMDDEKIEGVTGPTYSVASLQKEDFGEVEVYASYVDAEGLEYTSSYYFRTYMFTDFAIENGGNTKYVVLGSDVTLAPEFSKEPTGNVTYQWSYYRYENYRTKYIDIVGATSKEYVIPNVASGDLEKYRCTICVDGVEIGTYTVTLAEDTGTASISIDYAEGTQRYMDVRIGETVTIGVVANSDKDLDLKYQWYKGYWSDYALGDATESTLTIANITPEDADDYVCVVTDSQGNTNSIRVELEWTTGLTVNSEAWASNYYLGYEATLGGNATLAVNATIDSGNEIFYQWRKLQADGDGWDKIYGENASTFTLSNVTEDMLGKYSCLVSDAYGETITVLFVVYIDTGLVTVADAEDVLAEADGSVKMSVTSKADAGYTISYQWAKKQIIKKGMPEYDATMDSDGNGEYEGYVNIPNAVANTYSLSKITKADYGTYRVTVSTRGESYEYFFYLNPIYNDLENDKDFAQEGEAVNLTMKVDNAAVDETYTYEWWYKEPSTGNLRKVNCATATLSTTAPNIARNKLYSGYYNVTYRCRVKDAAGEVLGDKETYVTVIPTVTYSTALPETEHPFGKAYDIQGYQVPGAASFTVTFDSASELKEEELYVINGAGKGMAECYHGEAVSKDGSDCDCSKFCMNGEKEHTITVEGDTVILLLTGNEKKDSYGYKIKSIDVKWKPGSEPGATSGSAIKTVKKKISIGLKEKISVKVKGASYKSSKKKVVKVNKKGKVTGLKTGKAKVTVKSKTQKIIYTITVKKAPKKIKKVTPGKLKLKMKKKAKLKVKLPKGTASYNITYTTSNKKVTVVTKKGVVKAKKKGKCKITVMTYNGKKKTVKVTVKK